MDTNIKIEIETRNKRHYYDIALLVNRDDFIQCVVDLRKKWKIDRLFNPENYYTDFASHIWKQSRKNPSLFQKDIEKVRTVFERLPNFDEVIAYAIASNKIPDGVYQSCYAEIIPDPDYPEDESKYKYAVIITPNTIVDDISKVLAEFKKKIKLGLKQKKDAGKMGKAITTYQYQFGPNYTPPPQVIHTIIRDSNWYWQHKNGLSYQKIWNATPKNMRTANRDGVIKAIKAYTKRLTER